MAKWPAGDLWWLPCNRCLQPTCFPVKQDFLNLRHKPENKKIELWTSLPPWKRVIDDSITYREGPTAGELLRHCEQFQESPQVVGVGQRHQRWLFDLTRYNFFDFEPLLTVALSAGSPGNKIYLHLTRSCSSSQVCLTCSSRPRIRSLYILSLEFRLCSSCLRLAACLLCSLSLSAFLSLRVCVWVFKLNRFSYFFNSLVILGLRL